MSATSPDKCDHEWTYRPAVMVTCFLPSAGKPVDGSLDLETRICLKCKQEWWREIGGSGEWILQ